MIMHILYKKLTIAFSVVMLTTVTFYAHFAAADDEAPKEAPTETTLNSNFFYFYNGELLGNRNFNVSDPDNYGGVNAVNLSAKSSGGKVTMEPDTYRQEGDAIRVKWARKKENGKISLSGPDADLTIAQNIAALTMELRINRMSKKDVKIGLDCHYPCGAELSVGKQLRKSPKKEWFTFPIPLNCFQGEDFDISKISGPFSISTTGKMDISIANIRLERLPEGEAGCVQEAR